MHSEFARIIQDISDRTGAEVTASVVWDAFENEYLRADNLTTLLIARSDKTAATIMRVLLKSSASVTNTGNSEDIDGKGNGPIDAFSKALKSKCGLEFKLLSYYEHAIDKGSDSRAAAYIQIESGGRQYWGTGIDTSIDRASFKAILSALNRANREGRSSIDQPSSPKFHLTIAYKSDIHLLSDLQVVAPSSCSGRKFSGNRDKNERARHHLHLTYF